MIADEDFFGHWHCAGAFSFSCYRGFRAGVWNCIYGMKKKSALGGLYWRWTWGVMKI